MCVRLLPRSLPGKQEVPGREASFSKQQKHIMVTRPAPKDWPCSFVGSLELESGCNLHLPHVGGSAVVGPEVTCGEGIGKTGKVGMIQEIENFPTQLQVLAFHDFEVLADRGIKVS